MFNSAEWGPFIGEAGGVSRVGSGYARYNLTTVKRLTDAPEPGGTTLPSEARHAIISVKDSAIRIRTDGIDPTTTDGRYSPAGEVMVLEDSATILRAWRMVSVSGAAEVTVEYFY